MRANPDAIPLDYASPAIERTRSIQFQRIVCRTGAMIAIVVLFHVSWMVMDLVDRWAFVGTYKSNCGTPMARVQSSASLLWVDTIAAIGCWFMSQHGGWARWVVGVALIAILTSSAFVLGMVSYWY